MPLLYLLYRKAGKLQLHWTKIQMSAMGFGVETKYRSRRIGDEFGRQNVRVVRVASDFRRRCGFVANQRFAGKG